MSQTLAELEKSCGADIVRRKIDLLDGIIGNKFGSGEPVYVNLRRLSG